MVSSESCSQECHERFSEHMHTLIYNGMNIHEVVQYHGVR